MTSSIDIWQMLAGIAFFLLAMSFMEEALRHLAGRKFKLFLKKQTASRLKAISGSAAVTGVLQSSSIVNLLLLSMVGAGIVKMEHSLSLILGSNLGSTINSWIVVTLGFKYNIDAAMLPLAGIAGVVLAFANREKQLYHWMKFLFGFAFLFIALQFIRGGMENLVQQTDLSAFNNYPLLLFLFLGIVLTALVQSSSATMALTLSALYSNAISLPIAMGIILGSEIGTTLKMFIASANGVAAQKRMALGNFIFNTVTACVMFLLLIPVSNLISELAGIRDSMIALVFFQTLTNIVSILLFFPLLNKVGQFLTRRFPETENHTVYISKVLPDGDADIALEALESETRLFIHHVIDYSLHSFHLEKQMPLEPDLKKGFQRKTTAEKYDHIKQSHGEIHTFYLRLQSNMLLKPGKERLEQLITAVRNMMYAAKNIRDAQHDIEQIRNSSNDLKYDFYNKSGEKLLSFYRQVLDLLMAGKEVSKFEKLTVLYHSVTTGYSDTLQQLYRESMASRVNEMEISTLINFNRELYTSFKSVLFSLKDFLLTPGEAEYFDAMPGFIR
ncbi:MAG: Na/Pi cotransporter family protein [Chitinophagaceae bacterium]|nr:Na/Pi cotransporter family protein [Chitinophagaceae bacterium]